MKRSTQRIWIILITLSLLITLFPISVWGVDDTYKVLPQMEDQSLERQWTVQFNHVIDQSEENINNETLYILNLSTNRLHPTEIIWGEDGRQVFLNPLRPYLPETEYRLYITEGIRTPVEPVRVLRRTIIMYYTTLATGEVDRTELAEAISEAEALRSSDYSLSSWRVLETALTEARAISQTQTATQQTVNSATRQLTLAMEELAVTVSSPGGGGSPARPPIQEDCTLEPSVLEDLIVVSAGLVRVIDRLELEEQKEVARMIKRNIDQKIENHCFDHLAQLPQTRSKYHELTSEQKVELQDAILYHISVQRLMRLADYFGF